MKNANSCILCAMLLGLSPACNNRDSYKPIAKQIPWYDGDPKVITFGAPIELLRVVITKVETLVVPHPSANENGLPAKPAAFKRKIISTAEWMIPLRANSMVFKTKKPRSNIRFEFISSYGTVVAIKEVPVNFSQGQETGSASVILTDISEFDVEHLILVRAYWVSPTGAI